MDPCYSWWADWIESRWASAPPSTVLDLCCGTGLMTAELAGRGYLVSGVDASPAMLERARSRLDPSVTLVEAWLPDLPLAGPFDAAVSTLDGLNYLDLADLSATLAAVAGVLVPGGWLILDVHGPGALPFAQEHPRITGTQGGHSFTLTTEVLDRRCITTIDFAGGNTRPSFTETHTQFLHTTEEIHASLDLAGFTVLDVVDEYSDAAVTETTLRSTWVARREDG